MLRRGAADRDRTGTVLPPRDFKSLASANSATAAGGEHAPENCGSSKTLPPYYSTKGSRKQFFLRAANRASQSAANRVSQSAANRAAQSAASRASQSAASRASQSAASGAAQNTASGTAQKAGRYPVRRRPAFRFIYCPPVQPDAGKLPAA